MGRSSTTPDGWHPKTQQDRYAILRELEKILASPHFCSSKRYPALLRYIVENALAGKSDLLKERTLAIEVFDRPETFDTGADTVVRFTAGEVRKRLSLYYHEQGKDSEIHISLPAGSYIPEFLHTQEKANETGIGGRYEPRHFLNAEGLDDWAGGVAESALAMQPGIGDRPYKSAWPPEVVGSLSLGRRRAFFSILPWALIAVAAIAGYMWKNPIVRPSSTVSEFWAPILRDQKSVVICTGSSVFAQDPYSGLITTGTNRNIEYPFVSIQGAAAIAQIEGTMEQSGIQTRLIAAPWATLTDLREHSVSLLGAFNNLWTQRLVEPLRFHFMQGPQQKIVDGMDPQKSWERDPSVPYSSADDYALVARFRDPTIDGWVMVSAGLGRNGTEAAAQFVTSPHYLDLLRERLGTGFGNRNIEVVLKVSVIEAKTGAPSIVAVHTW
jgi:hypothetical protein